MSTLFDITPDLPQGLHYFPNFLSEAEEQELVRSLGDIFKPVLGKGVDLHKAIKTYERSR